MEHAAALLRWYVEQGVDETIDEAPVDRFALPSPAPTGSSPAVPQSHAQVPARQRAPAPAAAAMARAPVPLESPQLVEDARALARRSTGIAELEAAIRSFEGCALKRTAKNT